MLAEKADLSVKRNDGQIALHVAVKDHKIDACIYVFSGNFPRQLWYSQLYFVYLLGQKSDQTVNISKTNGIKPDLDLSVVIKYYSSFATSPATAATPAHGTDEEINWAE